MRFTEQLGVTITLVTCIRKALGYNLGENMSCPVSFKRVFSPPRNTPGYNLDQAMTTNKSFKMYHSPPKVTTP